MKSTRLLAIALLALSAASAAQVAAQQSSPPPSPVPYPLARELERCKQLNERAASDDRCTAAYKESLSRFLTPPQDYQPPASRTHPNTPTPELVQPSKQ